MRNPTGAALLLSQLGSHVSRRFTERLEPLDLTPSHVGVLRRLAAEPGLSQKALATRVGAAPSRVVKLLDELEDRGLVERRLSPTDRRNHEIHLSPAAAGRLADVRRVVSAHDADLVRGLTPDDVLTLVALLRKVAQSEGLDTAAHPGLAAGRGTDADR